MSEDDADDFEFGALKVEVKTELAPGDAEITQHDRSMFVRDGLNTFRINDDLAKRDQVRNVFMYFHTLVHDWVVRLLRVRNLAKLKFHDQRILISLLQETGTQLVEYLHRSTDNLVGFFLVN